MAYFSITITIIEFITLTYSHTSHLNKTFKLAVGFSLKNKQTNKENVTHMRNEVLC